MILARVAISNKPITCQGVPNGATSLNPMAARRKFWIAVQTEYQSESLAAKSLRDIVPETYNPLYRERAKRGVRRVLPVLQGYLLVRVDRRVTILGDVSRARGVKKLMRGAGDIGLRTVYEISCDKIEWLRSLEGADGYVRLEGEEPPAFQFGESVMALSGGFREVVGSYLGNDPEAPSRRALVVYEILGNEIERSVSKYDLSREVKYPGWKMARAS